MNSEDIQQLAITEATEGLRGADLFAFEQWWVKATAEEKALYTDTIQLITMISESQIPEVKPSDKVKVDLMKRIGPRDGKDDPTVTVSSGNAIPGYSFLMNDEGVWRQLPAKGARIKELSCCRATGTAVFILEMDPGARVPSHHHRGTEEALVLRGDLQMRGKILGAGDYMRAEPGTMHQDLYSEGGCQALLITALENYPRRAIRLFDGAHRVWRQCTRAFARTTKD